jgi:soluble lytic murein transglycosylase-like protein
MRRSAAFTHFRSAVGVLCATLCSAVGAQIVCTDTQGRAMLVTAAAIAQLSGYRCASAPPSVGQRARDVLGLDRPPLVAAPPRAAGALQWVHVESGALRLAPPRRPALVEAGLRAERPALDAMIASAAREHGHDGQLLRAIIHVESNFDSSAVSRKGAIGLMQVMPATGKRLGVEDPRLQLFDPEINVRAGARYLRLLMDMFPDKPQLAIAAYNAGENAVLRHGRQIPPYRETREYVQRVLAQYEIYRSQ